MAEGLYLLYGLDAPRLYRAHLGHEQLTASVYVLREVRYKAPLGDTRGCHVIGPLFSLYPGKAGGVKGGTIGNDSLEFESGVAFRLNSEEMSGACFTAQNREKNERLVQPSADGVDARVIKKPIPPREKPAMKFVAGLSVALDKWAFNPRKQRVYPFY